MQQIFSRKPRARPLTQSAAGRKGADDGDCLGGEGHALAGLQGAVETDAGESIVNHISGHRGGIAGIYNRAVYMDERRRALEAWAKLITSSAADSTNVVPMRTGTSDQRSQ